MTIYIFVPFHVQNKLKIGILRMNAIQYMQNICLMQLYQRFFDDEIYYVRDRYSYHLNPI